MNKIITEYRNLIILLGKLINELSKHGQTKIINFLDTCSCKLNCYYSMQLPFYIEYKKEKGITKCTHGCTTIMISHKFN